MGIEPDAGQKVTVLLNPHAIAKNQRVSQLDIALTAPVNLCRR